MENRHFRKLNTSWTFKRGVEGGRCDDVGKSKKASVRGEISSNDLESWLEGLIFATDPFGVLTVRAEGKTNV